MKLSVVMTVRNGERYLPEAVASVLNQTLEDFELLIVDDASTDGTSAMLASYARQDSRIRILTNDTNRGPYPSANLALRKATGQAIARHDADDVSPPDRFAVQWEALASSDRVTLVTGWLERFGARGQRDAEIVKPLDWQPALEWGLLFSNTVGAGAHTMFPRVIDGVPVEYPARHRYAEDYELICRLATLGQVVSPKAVVYRYRQHDHSITRRQRAEQDQCVAAIRQERLSRHLPATISQAQIDDLVRFWLCDGARPLGPGVDVILATFHQLRDVVLDDIAHRYGKQARSTLAMNVDRRFHERVGYWLYRSARFRDRSASRELLRASIQGGPLRACLSAFKHGSFAVRHKF